MSQIRYLEGYAICKDSLESMDSISWKTVGLVTMGFVVLLVVASFASLWTAEYFAYQDLADGLVTKDEIPTRIDAHRRFIIQVAGGIVVIGGLYLTYWRTRLTDRQTQLTDRRIQAVEDGQVTERFTQAIEQLGSDEITIRLGGIYALERIAKDSPKDHWTVMETLTVFIRDESRSFLPIKTSKADDPYPAVSPDVQAALTVIGRRDATCDPEGEVLNLQSANLTLSKLQDANLDGVQLVAATLHGAEFLRTSLRGAKLGGADIRDSDLTATDLRGADLHQAFLENAIVQEADLREADLEDANLSRAECTNADFSNSRMADANLSNADLRRGIFREAKMTGANLSHARLRDADLSGAVLNGATLYDADFTTATLKKTVMDKTDLREAYFKMADMKGVMIAEADLRNATFRRSNMQGASIRSSDLRGAGFQGADLRSASLHNVDFCECGMLNEQGDGKVILPEETMADVEEGCPELLEVPDRT